MIQSVCLTEAMKVQMERLTLLPTLLLISCLLISAHLASATKCKGTNYGFTISGGSNDRYNKLVSRYSRNCTIIDGNLEIIHIYNSTLDYTHLHSIEEITGYLFVMDSWLDVLPLPNLRLIQGEELFTSKGLPGKKYSVLIGNNYNPKKTTEGLKSLGLNSLVEILRGDVLLTNNLALCNEKDVLWEDIVNNKEDVVFHHNKPKAVTCSKCSDKCQKYKNEAHCWGPSVENCQNSTRMLCKVECEDRCYGYEANQCCQTTCSGGCYGTGKDQCFACKRFLNEKQCVDSCPPLETYDPITYTYKPNPEAKYSNGHECVKECPIQMYIYKTACVKECPANFTPIQETKKCEPCGKNCPKRCKLEGEDYVSYKNIDSLEGCTVIAGPLKIVDGTFNDEFGNVPLTKEQLKKLESVTLIEDYLEVSATHENLKDLSFLKNLQSVHGKTLASYSSILIFRSTLESLELSSLKTISAGKLYIAENKELCYASNQTNWAKFTNNFTFKNNKNITICELEGKVCHEECSNEGCLGPHANDCLSCQSHKQENTCVSQCGKGYFSEPKRIECKACHPQCLNTCSGEGPKNCNKCQNVKDGPYCVAGCPLSKYPDSTGSCQGCHEVCEGGCYGPNDQQGLPDGCKNCSLVLMNPSNTESIKCLPAEQGCPESHYKYRNKECRQCHSECTKCMGHGANNCDLDSCKNVIYNNQCSNKCLSDHYALSHLKIPTCEPCDPECLGCKGPTSTECLSCRNLKLYDDYEKREENKKFTCTSQCPESAPNKLKEIKGKEHTTLCVTDAYAQSSTGSKKSRLGLILGLIFGFLLLLALIILLIFYFRRQAAKKRFEVKRLEAKIGGYDDNEPLMLTNAAPDAATLRVIQEEELRKEGVIGSGAFGVVHKGVYVPRGENVKIPVAVKVLHEGSSSAQNSELLDEARIMASVNHPYCVRLTAICMTSPVQLVTPLMPFGSLLDYLRKHKANIGSKNLLNWATQIAKGMEYLEHRGIVHRDLAARNVLVKNTNVVKITDFGLSKLLDVDQSQIETQDEKLPIKWMAVESIRHKIFTHKSDVWSYGVTIWELFTYGSRPYDLLPAQDVLNLLEKGQRLSQPDICTIDIYMLMIKCWMMDSESRPCFKELSQDFSRFSRDPGRYIVIKGDEFMKLPNVELEAEDLISHSGPEKVISMDDYYLQPSEDDKNQGDGYLDPQVDYEGGDVKFTKGKKNADVKDLPSNRYTTDPTRNAKEDYERDADLDVAIDSAYYPTDPLQTSKQDALKGSLSSITDQLKNIASKARPSYYNNKKYNYLTNRDSIDNNNQNNNNINNKNNNNEYLKMDKSPAGKKARLAEFEDDTIDDGTDDYLTEVTFQKDDKSDQFKSDQFKNDYYNTKKY